MKQLFSVRDKFVGNLGMKIPGESSASSNDRGPPIRPLHR